MSKQHTHGVIVTKTPGLAFKTNFTAWPGNTMTEHTVERVWSCADGHLGASDYGYHLTPRPRGSNHRHIDELWLSPITKQTNTGSK